MNRLAALRSRGIVSITLALGLVTAFAMSGGQMHVLAQTGQVTPIEACTPIDFETVPGEGPKEGLLISKQFEKSNGIIFSQKLLLELARAGLSREEAYALVQEAAMETWQTGKQFEQTVRARAAITSRVDPDRLSAVFLLDDYLREVQAKEKKPAPKKRRARKKS